MPDVGIVTAFVAGALSISSPCVLPLIPLYLAHLAGVGADGSLPERRVVLTHALAFVAGFGVIFVLLGLSLGALGGVFLGYRDWIVRGSGLFMIVLGLQLIGVLRIPALGRPHRIGIAATGNRPGRVSSSFLVGIGFAAGWTPCVGPILGAIMTMAVGAADPGRSGLLLGSYALGLAVPFLLVATAIGKVTPWLRRASSSLSLGSGAVMTAVGALMLLGIYQQFFARIVGMASWTPWEPTL